MNNIYNQISEKLRALPEGTPVTPYIKPVLLLGPEQGSHGIPPAVKDSIRAWSEPNPTEGEVRATRDLYAAQPDCWPKLLELFDLLLLNCTLRRLIQEH